MSDQSPHKDIKPDPDPTTLTTENLRREIYHLRELVEARLTAIEDANKAFADSLQRVPTTLDRELSRLSQLTSQQFTAIEQRISAVQDTALARNQANTTAIDKAEANVAKQIDQLNSMTLTRTDGLREQLTTLSSRVDRGEGRQTGQSDQIGRLLAAGALGVSILSVFMGGAALFKSDPPPAVVAAPR